MPACTVGSLVNSVLAALAVSDRLSLPELWAIASSTLSVPEIDTFYQQVLWKALVKSANPALMTVLEADRVLEPHELEAHIPLSLGSEPEIFIQPTEECQFRYLTNTVNYQSLKLSLGDLPFQLLKVIARHGTDGILNPELARESGQDARSLRLRLQKLEAAGLIQCKNVFLNKTHTTHSIHTKFVNEFDGGKDFSEAEEDLDTSRDVGRLKMLIIEALKKAPNQLRGFTDLKKDFKLDASESASKFFKSVCFKLHQSGYIEKLNVVLPETKQRLYAMKFIKDMPKDSDDFYDVANVNNDQAEDEIEDTVPAVPCFNQFFPPFHQIFEQIHHKEQKGITSGEIARNIMGLSDYRPYTRLYESLPSYLSNGKTLKPFKKYAEPYDNYSVSKLYDNEGKLKFYRYFSKEFCSEEKAAPLKYTYAPKVSNSSLDAINKKLASKLGKMSSESLLEKRRKMFQTSSSSPAKKRKTQSTADKDDLDMQMDISEAGSTYQDGKRRSRRATTPKSYVEEIPEAESVKEEEEYDPKLDVAAQKEVLDDVTEKLLDQKSNSKVEYDSRTALTSNDLPIFVAKPRQERKRQAPVTTVKAEGSLKSMTRRNHLLDIIRKSGGVIVKSSSLCRKLDRILQNKTSTDLKTVARDIAYLVKTKAIKEQKIQIDFDDKQIEKKILILNEPGVECSPEKIEDLKTSHVERMSRKNMKIFKKRVIQSDMKLYVEQPSTKKARPKTRRRRGVNRLQNLEDEDDADSDGAMESETQDVFSKLKKSRRAKKVVAQPAQEVITHLGKRPRRNIKLEKSESTLLYRMVVISKAFTKDAIEFDAIAEFFPGLDSKLVKQKWGTLRRSFGGASAVQKGVETFQNMVIQGIEDGFISEQDLNKGDFKFFLDFWRRFDTSTEINIVDEMPLYATYQVNEEKYSIPPATTETAPSLCERIEDISMRQKEQVLGSSVFMAEKHQPPTAKPLDELRSVLKSIFSTKEVNFDPALVKSTLNPYGEDTVRQATDALLQDREILYVSVDTETKFVLSDRFHNTTAPKYFGLEVFQNASVFKHTLNEVSRTGKGLILSQGILQGEMATLLELVSEEMVDFTRIDKTFKFENYESRLIDKEQISCDIVVRSNVEQVSQLTPQWVAVPFIKPCQPIWVDLDAQINKDLWTKLLANAISQIVVKPGITDSVLYEKLQAVLSVRDYNDLMGWLIQSKCIKRLPFNGYAATNCWQFIFGQ